MTQRHLSSASGAPLVGSFESDEHQTYYYPQVPSVQRPSAAHVTTGKRYSEGQATYDTRVQSSISSGSGSSGISDHKRQAQAGSRSSPWPSPTLEQTLVNSRSDHYRRQSSPMTHTPSSRAHSHKDSHTSPTNSPALAYIRERRQIEQDDDEEDEDDHALWVWFWLSVLDPIHSLASCLFTLIVAFGLILALPTRLVHKQTSFGDQVIKTIAPMFKHHLEMMYAPSVDYAYEWDFRPGMLIVMHLISPLISVGVAIASWVSGAFWVFTYIMGNPDGTERGDDGADAVLSVRNWWEGMLLKSCRAQHVKQSMRSIV